MGRSTVASGLVALASLAAGALLVGVGCGESDDDGSQTRPQPSCELRLAPAGQPFERLSDYCFFGGDPASHDTVDAVVDYGVATKLYSDESQKYRAVVVPDGQTIGYDATDRWSFPQGTVFIKTFFFPVDARDPAAGHQLMETRLLVHEPDGWQAYVYLWDDDGQDARLHQLGKDLEMRWIDANGDQRTLDYRVPNKNQCMSCHGQSDELTPLGPRTRQLNYDFAYDDGTIRNQLVHWHDRGLFDQDPGDPAAAERLIDPTNEAHPLDLRARTYLEGNCAHCHSQTGGASNSGLFLGIEIDDPTQLGVCKRPVAAGSGTGGRTYDIFPGRPDDSIMVYRMDSNDAQIKMPELPLRTIDTFGVDLVTEWIAQMEGTCPIPE